jgi:hypothetical protein
LIACYGANHCVKLALGAVESSLEVRLCFRGLYLRLARHVLIPPRLLPGCGTGHMSDLQITYQYLLFC